jgi:iron complex outermembrane recepter protein
MFSHLNFFQVNHIAAVQQLATGLKVAASLGLLFLIPKANGQTPSDTLKAIDLQQVTITATMASGNTPMTFTNLKKEQIRRNDFGQDVPYLLKNTPSVVETSDGGSGIGYTGLRIRGSDATRINVTIDGIPLNDAESQNVYWVDLPDFSASTSMIQIQRGVGTSTNGAGAFGATVNMVTNPLQAEKYINYAGTYGSFNTLKNTISFGTGILAKHFSVDARISRITSDGYIDRASSKLGSAYLSALYFNDKTSVKIKAFTGGERTYQAWYGVPAQFLDSLRTYNPAGTEKPGTPYENQVDDYTQSHLHAVLNHQFNPHWKANLAFHYTKGKGFYEEYKANQKLKDYFDGVKDTTDLVRRLWLDNDFYGSIYSLTYEKNKLQSTLGGGYNVYKGFHYGTTYIPLFNPTFYPYTFYENTSSKTDFNLFEKLNYALSPILNGYLDLQYRHIAYNTEGGDRKKRDITRSLKYDFFNPKIGFFSQYTASDNLYGSFAVAHREPNRNDVIDGERTKTPQAERLFNTELGWLTRGKNSQFGVTFYHMAYKNQLVVTGQINDIGEAVRVNVPKSYRVGLEMEASTPLSKNLFFNANAAISQNKIENFTEFRDNWDTGEQTKINHGKTNLAFSPNAILNGEIVFNAFKSEKHDLSFVVSEKYVGKQFIDNTSNDNTTLPAYYFTDVKIFYKTQFGKIKNITCKLLINNILNQKYVNNAWTYRFTSAGYDPRPDDPYARSEKGDVYNLTGYFPQAGRNVLLGLSLGF